MQTVSVKWSGPYSLERVHNYDLAYDKGIYAISRVWGGKEKLLYIGRTKRQFQKRLSEHSYWLTQYRGQIRIRLGTVDSTSKKLVEDIEALLIIWHKAIENTSNTLTYSGRALTVQNTGRRGSLTKLISTEQLIDA